MKFHLYVVTILYRKTCFRFRSKFLVRMLNNRVPSYCVILMGLCVASFKDDVYDEIKLRKLCQAVLLNSF